MDIFGTSQTWFPVVTLVLGLVLKSVFDALTDRRTARREREARQEQRQDAFRLRRIEFQRASLLELQEAIQQLARFTGQSNHEYVMAYRTSGTWRKQPLTEEADQGFLRAQTSVGLLRVRIRDQEVRQLAEQFSKVCVDVVVSTSETAADHALRQITNAITELHERIGAILRNLDDDEDRIGAPARLETRRSAPQLRL